MLGWSEDGTAGEYVTLEILACKHTERKTKRKRGAKQHQKTTGTMEYSYIHEVLLTPN